MKRRSKKPKIELPDCILSIIFSKLGLKDLVKTSALSKRWLQEWRLRMDQNFDLQNMFDLRYNTVQELPKSLPLFQGFQSEFAKRLDQFMLHYQGDMISSIRVNFPLGDEYRSVIGRLISQGITKGAKSIELLLSYETNDSDFVVEIKPYKFSLTRLSHTDSLTNLHLQKCCLVAPMEFSGLKNLRTLVLHLVDVERDMLHGIFSNCIHLVDLTLDDCKFNFDLELCGLKNLRTLVLHLVSVKQDMLHGLFSNCIHLVDFTLDGCNFNSDLEINSSTLLNLNIVNCGFHMGVRRNIDIIASNLSSIEYSFNCNYPIHRMNIEAHMLSKFSYRGSQISSYDGGQIYKAFGFSGLKNVTTIIFDGLRECLQSAVVMLLFSQCLQLENATFKNCRIINNLNIVSPKLRHLKIIECDYNHIYPHNINISALNLSSFEYSGQATRYIFVTAPKLLKVFWNAAKREKNPDPFGPIARLRHIENLVMILSTSQVS